MNTFLLVILILLVLSIIGLGIYMYIQNNTRPVEETKQRPKQVAKDHAANHQKLKQQTQQRLTEDEKALPALEKSAKDANTIASLADVYASQQKWPLALAHYEKALSMGGLRREAETRLHAGIALSKAGQKDEASKIWDSVQGDPTAVELAQLWKIWQANQ